MRRSVVALAAAAAAFTALPAGAGSSVPITIRHQVHGCHTWAGPNGVFRAALTLRAQPGTSFTIANRDVMPHTLVQLAGPRIHVIAPRMAHMNAVAKVALRTPGTYRFKTVAGEDYPGMTNMKTVGEDNLLRLTVVVK